MPVLERGSPYYRFHRSRDDELERLQHTNPLLYNEGILDLVETLLLQTSGALLSLGKIIRAWSWVAAGVWISAWFI